MNATEELWAREGIRDLLSAYCHTADNHDAEGFRALWTKDATYDVGGEWGSFHPLDGPGGIVEGIHMLWRTIPWMHHWNPNISIKILDPEHATAYSSVGAHLFDNLGNFIANCSTYDDQLVKVGNAWKFQHRKVTIRLFRQVESNIYAPEEALSKANDNLSQV